MKKVKKIQQYIAIVLGPKCVNATGLIRSLGEAGCYVVFASTYPRIESKWTKEYLHLPNNEDSQIETLYQYICSLPSKPAVFTVDDKYNQLLDEQYERFEEVSFIPHAYGKLNKLCDKEIMSTIAQESGLIVPAFQKISLMQCSHDIELPIILKPYAGYAGNKGDIYICHSVEELKKAIETLKGKGYTEVLQQKLLETENQFEIGLLGIALPNGEVEIPCSIKKIRSYPEGRGSTSYAQVKQDFYGVEIETLKRFVRNTGYIGLFDIEMIVSKGIAYFIEINYRNGQYGYALTKAGYNLPLNWIDGMQQKPVQKNIQVQEIFYMNERDDKLHVRDGRISKKEWKMQFKSVSAYGMYCKGDQRPYIRQYIKIPDRVQISFKKIISRIKDLLIKEEWNLAIRPKSEKLLLETDKNEEFRVLKNTFRYWCADPFIITMQDKDYLFFEAYDRFKGKGIIGYRIIQNGKVGAIKKALECSKHLSFPFIFKKEDGLYMMPESSELQELSIYKAIDFPYEWKKMQTLITSKKLCDSIVIDGQNEKYLFTQPIEEETNFSCLDLYILDKSDTIIQYKKSIVEGKDFSRMGGNIFEYKGKYIRVSQNCANGYGTSIAFHEIEKLSYDGYTEKMIRTIKLHDISENFSKKYRGIHTYNFSERYEVIDIKRKNRVHLGNMINLFYRAIKKIWL